MVSLLNDMLCIYTPRLTLWVKHDGDDVYIYSFS
jgi:hypothetical protein